MGPAAAPDEECGVEGEQPADEMFVFYQIVFRIRRTHMWVLPPVSKLITLLRWCRFICIKDFREGEGRTINIDEDDHQVSLSFYSNR